MPGIRLGPDEVYRTRDTRRGCGVAFPRRSLMRAVLAAARRQVLRLERDRNALTPQRWA
jgi:hypothetical protein